MTTPTRSDDVRRALERIGREHADIVDKPGSGSLHVRIWWKDGKIRVRADVKPDRERVE